MNPIKTYPKTPVEKFRFCLAKTIVWSTDRVVVSNLQGCLRTESFRPPLLAGNRKDMVAHVDSYRHMKLGLWPEMANDLAGGKLLFYQPDANISDGAAELETEGFFDAFDTPPWDTWVWYVREEAYLISWVPPELIDIVNKGIAVNMTECIGWLENKKWPFVESLREIKLIPL